MRCKYNLLPLLWVKITEEFTTSPQGRPQKAVSWFWKRKYWLVKGTARLNLAGSCHEREGCPVNWALLKENLLRAQRNKAEEAMYVMPLSSMHQQSQ